MLRTLDVIYRISLRLSALCLVAIALLVGAQIAGRLLDGALSLLHLPRTNFIILSLNEICGFLLGAATFLALAGTLKAGAHIRVTMVLSSLNEKVRQYLELWAFAFGSVASVYMTWHLISFAWVSFKFHDVAPGIVRVPLWYPQAAMAIGALVLTVALVDEWVCVLRRGVPSIRAAEDSISLAKE